MFATALFIGAAVAWSVSTEPITTRELVAFGIAAGGVAFVIGSHHDHDH